MQVDAERLAREFVALCETESLSQSEAKVCRRLKEVFTELGAESVIEDQSAAQTGADCGNLLVRFSGTLPLPPLFFACHMDTVGPAQGIRVQRQDDLFTSRGDTVLGGDDKSGIVACIEAMRVLRETGTAHRPVELLFTTCEEIGLLGAKAFDVGMLTAKEGYALDGGSFGEVDIRAPALNRLIVTVSGVAAHAGAHPEWGVSAIILAAKALADMPQGRVDKESTINFGLIQGGTAINIVPDKVVVEGEVRSHNPEKLAQLTEAVRNRFVNTARHWTDPGGAARGKPRIEVQVKPEFPVMQLAEQAPVIRRIDQAAASLGLNLRHGETGGGSDANILNGKGLITAVVGTGMTNIHATNEQIALADMTGLTRLLLALLTDVSF